MTATAAQPPRLPCPKCQAPLGDGNFAPGIWDRCPACKTPLEFAVFPALFRTLEAAPTNESILVAGESACFYHAEKRAVVPCAACGRFLCALCDCQFQGEHLCPSCLELGRRKGSNDRLVESRVLHQENALRMAFIPLLITGLAALYVAIRHRKAPPSLVSPKPWAMTVATIVAIVQVLAFAALITWLIVS